MNQHSAGIHAVTENNKGLCTDSISNSFPVLKTQFETGKMFLSSQEKEGSSLCVCVCLCVCTCPGNVCVCLPAKACVFVHVCACMGVCVCVCEAGGGSPAALLQGLFSLKSVELGERERERDQGVERERKREGDQGGERESPDAAGQQRAAPSRPAGPLPAPLGSHASWASLITSVQLDPTHQYYKHMLLRLGST